MTEFLIFGRTIPLSSETAEAFIDCHETSGVESRTCYA